VAQHHREPVSGSKRDVVVDLGSKAIDMRIVSARFVSTAVGGMQPSARCDMLSIMGDKALWRDKGDPRSAIALELVKADDFEALATLRIEAMRESLERIGRFDAERARARLAAGFDPSCTWHIVEGSERVGFVALREHDGQLTLEHLYVRPSAQGRGIGSAVLVRLFAESDARARPIRVGALRDSASNRFYVRHGFRLIERGELDNYYVRPAARASSLG
jgi:ribosomal protein S18 acetylase RimI-like enzyme